MNVVSDFRINILRLQTENSQWPCSALLIFREVQFKQLLIQFLQKLHHFIELRTWTIIIYLLTY